MTNDPFWTAKHEVEFAVGNRDPQDNTKVFVGRFIRRDTEGDQIAVTPAVRQAVAAINHSPFPDLDAGCRARILSLPVRDDGLVHLQHIAIFVTKNLSA